MTTSNQKLVILYGLHNSGKTFLYNLFKRDSRCKTLEIYKNHYHIHKPEWLEEVGEENTKRVEKHILSGDIFSVDCFLEEINFLMEQFSEYDFVVKPGQTEWLDCIKDKNIKHLFAIRHPKISLATCYDHNTDINDYVERWKLNHKLLERYRNVLQVIKIESIDGVDKAYTNFDLNDYRLNIFERLDDFKSDLKVIDSELKDLLDFLGYKPEDENVDRYLRDLDILRKDNA
jgi:hypothetical protein